MADAISIKFDHRQMDAAIDKLAEAVQVNLRPAAQAAAQVLYDEAVLTCPIVETGDHYFQGKSGNRYHFEPGSLKKAIYQAWSKDRSDDAGKVRSTYHIAWRHKTTKGGEGVPYGYMVHNGWTRTRAPYKGKDGYWYTSKTVLPAPIKYPPKPFLFNAFDHKGDAALAAAQDRWVDDMLKAFGP